jgi:GT2 family glycosyltransferase
MAAADPGIRLLDNPDKVVPNGMNVGIEQSRGEVIIRADAHAEYPRDYVESLVSALIESGADNVGGAWITVPGSGTKSATAVAIVLSSPFGVGNATYRVTSGTRPVEVDTVPFGCYWRTVFDRVGYFDTDLIRNQDDEFNARLVRSGGRIALYPNIRVRYFARDTIGKMAKMMFQYGWYKPLVAIKNGKPATSRQLVPPAFVCAMVLLPLLALIIPAFLRLWLLMVVAYFIVDVAVSLRAAARAGWTVFPYVVAAFPAAHVSYGAGYLRGVWDFVWMRRHVHRRGAAPSLSR